MPWLLSISYDTPDSVDLQQPRAYDDEVGCFPSAQFATPGTGVREICIHTVGDA